MLKEFQQTMKELLGDDFQPLMDSLKQEPRRAIHLNTNKDTNYFIPTLFHLPNHPYVKNGYYFNKEQLPLGRLAFHDAGLYYIQEPSAMLVSELADLKKGMKVLDLCAAPGGKATKAGLLIGEDGLLIANDINYSRAKILSENIERLGLKNTIVTSSDAKSLAKALPGFFDAIILDAPCSGEGMFRKLDQAIDTWSSQKVEECQAIQKELIDACNIMLKENGILMYSTCTYEKKENEDIVLYAQNSGNFQLLPLELKEGFRPGINMPGVLRLYPCYFEGEGHFISKLQKITPSKANKIAYTIANISKQEKKLLDDFYKQNLNIQTPTFVISSNGHLYQRRADFPELNKIRVLRSGLYLGECKKNRFEPSHSLALTLNENDVKFSYNFDYKSEEIARYLHGETLVGQGNKGYGLICVNHFSLGFVKESQNILKNHFPKGLRKP